MTILSCGANREAEDIDVLSHEVHEMRQCQRKADNLHFYIHKYGAEKIINKYKDDYSTLPAILQREYMVASTRYSIVLSDYLLQIGNHKEAIKVIDDLASSNTLNLNADTLLWLNYLSHQGAVRFIPVDLYKNRKDIEKGYDCLMQCYILASRNNISLYKAVSMQQLSRYLRIDGIFSIVKQFDGASLRYLNEDNVPDSLLAGNLAQRALDIFLNQKDPFLTAEAWRNLSMCYFRSGNAEKSIQCLNNALAIPDIDSTPDLKASLSEQMSMSYAALNNKHLSDFYRNQYLDLQDSTRQDRQLEARAIELQTVTQKTWILVGVAFMLFLLLCLITVLLVHLRHKKMRTASASTDEQEELVEHIAMAKVHCSDALRAQMELRAQVSVINGMMPLIERMRNAIQRGDNDYAREVAQDIDRQNNLLTQWIKLQKGAIAPKIETFDINDVFEVVATSNKKSVVKNLLLVEKTSTLVKADRTLTLFILNTLISNSKKSIDDKGTIIVSCQENKDEHYAEISVADTGKGMTEEQLDHLFEVKPISDESLNPTPSTLHPQTHGFGLQNCKGIIDCYRKISSLFSVCQIRAKSKLGQGTTISFRLPLVLKMLLLMLTMTLSVSAKGEAITRYADSLYINNINGNYSRAMLYADSCIALKEQGDEALLLSVYNETAVAALALHQWNKYLYYNYLYTSLYKDFTKDASLPEYITKMNRSEMIANISMLAVIILFVALLTVFWFVYMKPLVKYRRDILRKLQLLQEEYEEYSRKAARLHLQNNIVCNQLSMVKHETMYYPSRIMQELCADASAAAEALDTVRYYSQLCSLLSNKMIAEQLNNSALTIHTTQLCGIDILADEDLLGYLLLLLKRHNGGEAPIQEIAESSVPEVMKQMAPQQGGVQISFLMNHADFTDEDIPQLFDIGTINSDYLIMKQIMREIGKATLFYAAGIFATSDNNGKKKIHLLFPRKKVL